jgi:hypothetical protein
MTRTLLLAVLVVPAALAGPPEGPSARTVLDEVPQLQAEVRRLEREAARDRTDQNTAEELALARARLATAERRTEAARSQWRTVIASREARLAQFEARLARGVECNPAELVMHRGSVAEARCGLAEVERDRAALARELPKVIDFHEARLKLLDHLRTSRAIRPEEAAEDERASRQALRQARARLDAVTQGRK